MVGGMGHASMVANGVSLNIKMTLFVLMAMDVLMHLGY